MAQVKFGGRTLAKLDGSFAAIGQTSDVLVELQTTYKINLFNTLNVDGANGTDASSMLQLFSMFRHPGRMELLIRGVCVVPADWDLTKWVGSFNKTTVNKALVTLAPLFLKRSLEVSTGCEVTLDIAEFEGAVSAATESASKSTKPGKPTSVNKKSGKPLPKN